MTRPNVQLVEIARTTTCSPPAARCWRPAGEPTGLVAVNEALGFRPAGQLSTWSLRR